MNQIKRFTNDETESKVRVIKNLGGSLSINTEEAAIGFGWIQIKDGKAYVEFDRPSLFSRELGYSPHVGKDDYVSEGLCVPKCQDWLILELFPESRKAGESCTIARLINVSDQ